MAIKLKKNLTRTTKPNKEMSHISNSNILMKMKIEFKITKETLA